MRSTVLGSGIQGPVADQADAVVEAFEPAVAQPEADRVEDSVLVAADRSGELDERLEPGARRPRQPRVEMLRRQGGVFEVVEQPEIFLQEDAR